MAIGLQWGEEDVEKPQAEEQHGGQGLRSPGPTKLPTDLRPPPVHQGGDTDEGKYGEECDGESQSAGVDLKLVALAVVVDGSNGPRHLPDRGRHKLSDVERT